MPYNASVNEPHPVVHVQSRPVFIFLSHQICFPPGRNFVRSLLVFRKCQIVFADLIFLCTVVFKIGFCIFWGLKIDELSAFKFGPPQRMDFVAKSPIVFLIHVLIYLHLAFWWLMASHFSCLKFERNRHYIVW